MASDYDVLLAVKAVLARKLYPGADINQAIDAFSKRTFCIIINNGDEEVFLNKPTFDSDVANALRELRNKS